MSLTAKRLRRKSCLAVATLLLALSFTKVDSSLAQAQKDESANSNQPRPELLRLEKRLVDGGAELITLSAQLSVLSNHDSDPQTESMTERPSAGGEWVPFVTVLRDTLGDANAENDRLRYVWALTYTRTTTGTLTCVALILVVIMARSFASRLIRPG